MTDLVDIIKGFCDDLKWDFTYGNKSNQNLLESDKVDGKIYLLLDPVKRNKKMGEFGGSSSIEFGGTFMVVVKSELDSEYYGDIDAKYEKNIKPMLANLELLEDKINCSNYEIINWEIIDTIDELDVNLDGLFISYTIKYV